VALYHNPVIAFMPQTASSCTNSTQLQHLPTYLEKMHEVIMLSELAHLTQAAC